MVKHRSSRAELRQPRILSITHVIVLVLVVMSLIPLLAGAWRMLKVGQEFLTLKIQEEQISIADRIAVEIEQTEKQARLALHALTVEGQYLFRTNMDDVIRRGELDALMKETVQYGNWLTLGIFNSLGDKYILRDDYLRQLGITREWEDALQKTLIQNQWTGPLLVKNHRVFRIYGFKYGKELSVIGLGLYELTSLEDILKQYQAPGRIITVITQDPEPIVLFSTLPDILKPGMTMKHPMSGVTATRQSLYEVHYGKNRMKVTGVARPVRVIAGILLLETDSLKAMAVVRQMAASGLKWAAGAGIIVLIFALALGGLISHPIQSLADITTSIARKRNFHHRLVPSGFKEFRLLKTAFNVLLDEIQEYVRQVEIKAEENRRMFYNSVRMITAAIDTKDPYTRGHSERVSVYARTIAEYMDFGPEEVERIYLSALLHDVGKIGIQDRILQKPAALTDEEYEIMKTHPEKGYKIMREVEQLGDVVPGMRYHHESWDGSGYPFGLKYDEIPLIARIVAVADSFDAMTTNRPYQKKMTLEKAVERIVMLSGKRFDPHVVQAFVRSYEEGALKIVEEEIVLEDDTIVGTQIKP